MVIVLPTCFNCYFGPFMQVNVSFRLSNLTNVYKVVLVYNTSSTKKDLNVNQDALKITRFSSVDLGLSGEIFIDLSTNSLF